VEAIPPALFPPPSRVVKTLIDLYQKGLPFYSTLLNHVSTTLQRLFLGTIFGVLLGVVVGVLMGLFRHVNSFLTPLIMVLMPIPGIALAPLFIIWFGFGNLTIILLGIMSAFFPVVFSTIAGIQSIDKQLIRAADIMGASFLRKVLTVYLPWAAGYVFNGVKLGLARCWMTVIAVEFIAATNWGLGYMIWNASEMLRADIVFGGILIMIIIFFILDNMIIKNLEKHTIGKWGVIRHE